MPGDFQQKAVFVTGVARGRSRSHGLAFAARGARIVSRRRMPVASLELPFPSSQGC